MELFEIFGTANIGEGELVVETANIGEEEFVVGVKWLQYIPKNKFGFLDKNSFTIKNLNCVVLQLFMSNGVNDLKSAERHKIL